MKPSNLFLRFFPPPAFLEMPAVGIEISSRFVRFAELRNKREGLVLGSYGEKKISENIISGGEIMDVPALQKVLSEFREEHRLSFVRASLPEQKGYIFTMELPRVRKKELRGSIALGLEDNVPLAGNEASFDYEVASCSHAEKNTFFDTSVAVMPTETVARYADAFSGAFLTPVSFELEAHALSRALIRKNDCRSFLIVDIGATRTGVMVVHDGIVRFTATIPLGGETITEAIARGLRVSKEEAVLLKESYGLTRPYEKGDLLPILTQVVGTFRDEVMRHLTFWNTRSGRESKESAREIEAIILSGGEANVPGLVDYLSGSLNLKVSLGNPWTNITSFESYIPELSQKDSLRYATALGLALGAHDI